MLASHASNAPFLFRRDSLELQTKRKIDCRLGGYPGGEEPGTLRLMAVDDVVPVSDSPSKPSSLARMFHETVCEIVDRGLCIDGLVLQDGLLKLHGNETEAHRLTASGGTPTRLLQESPLDSLPPADLGRATWLSPRRRETRRAQLRLPSSPRNTSAGSILHRADFKIYGGTL